MSKSNTWQRTHNCGALRPQDTGKTVVLNGWVASQRDHGGVLFVNLRDRWGITQVVFHPEQAELIEKAKNLKLESTIGLRGKVVKRPENMVNPNMPTGGIEVAAEDLVVYSEAKPLPFAIKDPPDALDETRLKYRYLDLRRPAMQRNMILRHKAAQLVRRYFDEKEFLEIETPFLMKSTPEGARDYLVPSRMYKGRFYALPQSPQTYKQLLMVSGFDRYFQIVRCFRDEDLRADRQPEFTQIDVEMSFVDEEAVFDVMEGLMVRLFKEILGKEVPVPFPRLPYPYAMAKYGVDKPDLRFGIEIQDLSVIASQTEFQVFRDAVASGGAVRGFCAPGIGALSRKDTDQLAEFVKTFGAKGLVTLQVQQDGIKTPIAKFVSEGLLKRMAGLFDAKPGDVIFIVAADEKTCCAALGNLRNKIAADQKMIKPGDLSILWVTDFPLVEWDEKEKRFLAMHHPFTSPKPEDVQLMDSDPAKVRARAYDLVLNGSEIAGGSIRIHSSEIQQKMFHVLGIDADTARRKFGYLMDAFQYGAPPHGGIAFGFDRLVAMLAGEDSIREVIAFPKTTSALSLMDGSPSEVDIDQLRELGIRLE